MVFLSSEDGAGASPGGGWATVAMFVVGKWWLFSQGISQLKHRDLHIIWAPRLGTELCSLQHGMTSECVVSGPRGGVRGSQGHVPPPDQAFQEAAVFLQTVCTP